MPMYDYKCKNENCVNHSGFRIELRMSEIPLGACTECGSGVERIYTPLPSFDKNGHFFGKSKKE